MNYFVKFLPVEGEIKEGETGYECALWMKVFYEERKKDLPTIFVHSMNPVGTEKIKNLFI